ncbi:MAG: DUF4443 domain-containing protein [Candidatus Methanofastidiosia archaeon]
MRSGPTPHFFKYDIFRTLKLIETEGPIGRHLLKKKLNITECSVRTIIKKLLRSGFIESSMQGQKITKRGRDYLSKHPYFRICGFVNAGNLSLGKCDFCIVGRNLFKSVGTGIAQRDEAIKVGGEGATVLIFKEGNLQIPTGFLDVGKSYPDEINELKNTLDMKEDDVVVIGSGKNRRLAQLAAMAAFDSLL